MNEPIADPLTYAEPEKPPHPWNVLNDFSKSVVTLASGLLAITVTFSANFLEKGKSPLAGPFLILAWLFLATTIVLGVLATAKIIEGIRGRDPKRRSILYNNCAFYALAGAAFFFLIAGVLQVTAPQPLANEGRGLEQAVAFLPGIIVKLPKGWQLDSLKWEEKKRVYNIVVRDDASGSRFFLVAMSNPIRILEVQRVPRNP